ncbi:unnamed protein product [Linum tenue]|uniref:glutathione gamma-glutamylcysteinyltransferase n=1 Tax=Linum tenue TaxID=586396 RepID=A0AAV0LM73_9ROSI|nr:unnamed protein product [Linum tenue]
MAMAGLYRRILPSPPAIDFASSEGKQIFLEALQNGTMEGFYKLISSFQTQSEPAYCGLASLSMVLNALAIDPGRKWKGNSSNRFLIAALCEFGLKYELRQARVLVQTGTGHFSPIGGYHAGRDMALILDVARFKYPPHWVPLSLLWEAMNAIDVTTGHHRGFILLSRPRTEPGLLYTLSCKQESWSGFAKYLIDEVPVLLKSDDLEDIDKLLQVVLVSLPSHFGDFIKWIAEVRRQEDGGENISQEEKGRLAMKVEWFSVAYQLEMLRSEIFIRLGLNAKLMFPRPVLGLALGKPLAQEDGMLHFLKMVIWILPRSLEGYNEGANDIVCEIVGLDVVRTDQSLEFYQNEVNSAKLWDILAVYSWVDMDIGYMQEDLDGGEYLFAFRMLMVLFRREFSFVDSLYLWELMWAMEYNPNIFTMYEESKEADEEEEKEVAAPASNNKQQLQQYGKFERKYVQTGITDQHSALSIFLVASILEAKNKKILKEAKGLDDVVQILGDATGNLDAKKVCQEALKIHKKYLSQAKK